MKTIKKLSIAFAITALAFAAPSCSKLEDFGDTNLDPTRVSIASTRALLTNALQNSLPTMAFGNTTANLYVQYLSEGPYPGASRYSGKTFANDAIYVGPLNNLQAIIDYNEDPAKMNVEADPGSNGSHANQIAVARILKAFSYWHMTDRWGPIPYSAALKGAEDFTPSYDSQESIYTDLFKELREAVAQMDNGSGPGGDILFDGDMAAWAKFANTQRMIMALRLSKVNPTLGKTEFEAAITAGVLESNNDNVLYNFVSGDPNNFNPWYNNYSISLRNDYALSNTLVDYMTGINDPRLEVYGEVLPSGKVVGLLYGSRTARNIPNAYSRIGDFFRGQNSPALIFSYSQVLFSMAEAAHIGWISGGDVAAATFYNEAIEASFEYYGVGDASAYLAQAGVVYSPANAVERIITQKWLHLYLNGYEAWAEWRRTGFPTLTPAVDYVSSQKAIPRRQGYGTNEALVNKENYDAAVSTLLGGADDLYTRLWWDKP